MGGCALPLPGGVAGCDVRLVDADRRVAAAADELTAARVRLDPQLLRRVQTTLAAVLPEADRYAAMLADVPPAGAR